MRSIRRGISVGICVCSIAALAQDSASERDVQPRPAEIAPLAAKTLLLALTMADGKVAAVGDRGTILLSADGEQWQQSPAPVHATLTTVAFADAQHGWAAGHDAAILRTADGGRTWALQHFTPEDSRPVLSLLALDAQRAYAAGAYGMFLATADGGATWSPVEAPAILEDGRHLNSLIRLNNGEFFVAGETGLIGASADGVNWTRLTQPYEGSLFGALPRGDKGALIFGMRGNVLVTDDVRGGRWTEVETGTVQSLFGGTLLADGSALLVGADGAMLRVGAGGKASRAGGGEHLGTLSAVRQWQDRLLVAGEQGVSLLDPPAD